MKKLISTAAAVLALAPAANAFPVVGSNGLTPNAWALLRYIQANYPQVHSIGGVRADALPDHPSGRALDIMVGGDTALGNAIYADLAGHMAQHSISYMLWQVPYHYDHIHVTVF